MKAALIEKTPIAERQQIMAIDVIAGIIERDGKALVARRKSADPLAGLWEFPGGKLERGESHQQCLHRELKEELAIICTIGGLVADVVHDYGNKKIHLYAYRVRIEQGEPVLHDHDELLWIDESQFELLAWASADIPIVEAYRLLLQQQRRL